MSRCGLTMCFRATFEGREAILGTHDEAELGDATDVLRKVFQMRNLAPEINRPQAAQFKAVLERLLNDVCYGTTEQWERHRATRATNRQIIREYVPVDEP